MPGRLLTSIFLAGLAAIATGPAAWAANPSDQEVHAALEPHDLTKSRPGVEQTHALIQEASTVIQAAVQKGGIILAKDLSATHSRLQKARRGANDLQLQGEPAGADFLLRVTRLETRLTQLLEQFKATNAGAAQAGKIRAFLASPKNAQVRENAVQRIQQLSQREQWLPAYAALCEAMDELTSCTMFLPPQEASTYLTPFVVREPVIVSARNQVVGQQVRQTLFEAGTAQLPNLTALVGEIQAAAAALRTQATAHAGDQALTGPQCVEHYGNAWKKAHLAAHRARAVEWARLCSARGVAAPPGTADPQRMKEETYGAFCDAMVKGLAALLDADTQRATAEEVPNLYLAYLRALAPLVTQSADQKLAAAAEAALERLAAKSPDFAQEQRGYREATGEALRWRARVAASRANTKAAGTPSSDELLVRAFAGREKYDGLVAEKAAQFFPATLRGCCPEVLMGGSPRLVNQAVVVHQGRGLTGGKLGVAQYANRHYAMLGLAPAEEQVSLLEHDLLVTEQLPALSLPAAVAIEAAARGDFVAAGGVVKTVYLEGLIPRFATIRDSALPLLPLGLFPPEPAEADLLTHVVARLDVTPQWLQSGYFFVDLGAAPTPGGTPQ